MENSKKGRQLLCSHGDLPWFLGLGWVGFWLLLSLGQKLPVQKTVCERNVEIYPGNSWPFCFHVVVCVCVCDGV